MELLPLPDVAGVVVALGALDLDAHEDARRFGGPLLGAGLAVLREQEVQVAAGAVVGELDLAAGRQQRFGDVAPALVLLDAVGHPLLDRRAGSAALRAQEEERARVARDLHDEVNQSLTGLLLRLEALREAAPPELEPELADTKALANQAMRELLSLARQLRPTALDDLGLAAAIARPSRAALPLGDRG